MFSVFLYFFPNLLNHADNYVPADPLTTPAHIVPEWYFLPYYAILRSIPHKLGGVIAMFASLSDSQRKQATELATILMENL